MFGKLFGGSSSVSAQDARKTILKACDLVREAKAAGPSLRRVIADAVGTGTSPDSRTVTAVVGEVARYGGMPAGAELTNWWDSADKSTRINALSQTAQALQ